MGAPTQTQPASSSVPAPFGGMCFRCALVPLHAGDTFQDTPSGGLKQWLVLNPMYSFGLSELTSLTTLVLWGH